MAIDPTTASPHSAAPAPAYRTLPRPMIVAVDDEPNILAALRRTLREIDADFAGFESGDLALAAIAGREPTVIISDMRMPGMDGADFLSRAKALHPQSFRILLTGHADHDKGIAAVNSGGIWKHLSKPWNDEELERTVREAIRIRTLSIEKAALEAVVRQQRDALASANRVLEAEVRKRTRELQSLNADLERRFDTLVRMLSGIIDARFGAGRTHRIATIAARVAKQMGLAPLECARIERAALLHPIGRIAFPDSILSTRPDEFTHEQVQAWQAYPANGEDMLMPLDDLKPEARIIRSHCERFDGLGFPDGLAGDAIPIGSRILSAAILFDQLLGDNALEDGPAVADATHGLARRAEKRLDPRCCEAIVTEFRINGQPRAGTARREHHVETLALAPGMVLSRDALAASGTLLLAAGQRLTAAIIAQLQAFELRHGTPLRLWIADVAGQAVESAGSEA